MTGDGPSDLGPYRLEALLGRGGMGEVYRAVDRRLGRTVALKLLAPGLAADRPFMVRFRREAELAARLSDPHVVTVHEYGEIDGRPFLDMQWIDGRDLGAVLAEDGPLPPERAVQIAGQVAQALDAAHRAGLVHRDVKPANILVAGRPEVAYLVDFGIAAVVDPGSRTALTRTGAVVGTLSYMAPERFLAEPAGPPADVYALACVLHELLTGQRPFPGTGWAAQVLGHLELPPPRASSVRAGLPPGLDGVIARGMAKEPGDRPPTAGALAEEARSVLRGPDAPVGIPVSRPAWRPPRTVRTARRRAGRSTRRRAVALVTAALVVAALVGTAGVLVATGSAATGSVAGPAAALPVTDRTLPGLSAARLPLNTGEIAGRPVLVEEGDYTLEVLDLATGTRLGPPIGDRLSLGGGADVASAVTTLDGRGVVLVVDPRTGTTVEVWDVAGGTRLPVSLTAPAAVTALAVVGPPDAPLVLVGGQDGTVQRVDLRTGNVVGEPWGGPAAAVTRLEVGEGPDPVVVAADAAGGLHSWELATGEPAGPPVVIGNEITSLVVTTVGGRPVAAVGDYVTPLAVHDVLTGAPLPGFGPDPEATAVGIVEVGGRLVRAVAVDDVVELVDPGTGLPVGPAMPGHEGAIAELSPLRHDGRTYLLSRGDGDNTVRVWDLTARVAG